MSDNTATAMVACHLRSSCGERLYGDSGPLWRVGRADNPSMSSEHARILSRRDVKMFRRHGGGEARVFALAHLIEGCRPGGRCLSGACIQCRRAMQKLGVSAGSTLTSAADFDVLAVSVVAREAFVRVGELDDSAALFQPFAARLASALAKAGIPRAFGGFDVSVNEHVDGDFSAHYRPHVWMFVARHRFERGEQVFRDCFRLSKTVRRAVVAKVFDGRRRGLAYALKTEFQRRVTLPWQTDADGQVIRSNTKDRDLRASQKVELGLALHELGLGDRLFLHGLVLVEAKGQLRIVRAPDGEPAAVATAKRAPPPRSFRREPPPPTDQRSER